MPYEPKKLHKLRCELTPHFMLLCMPQKCLISVPQDNQQAVIFHGLSKRWNLGFSATSPKRSTLSTRLKPTKYFRKQPNNLPIKLKIKIYVAQSGFVWEQARGSRQPGKSLGHCGQGAWYIHLIDLPYCQIPWLNDWGMGKLTTSLPALLVEILWFKLYSALFR